jgi:uncharacterized membrane protein YgaE (UPF0421/DUF939 family)
VAHSGRVPLLHARVRALRLAAVQIVQTAAAAGAAWLVAHDLIGHRAAFFAPIAAIIALGVGPGRRIRRAVEMVVGVAVGIAVGDLLIGAIGRGAPQLGLLVLLAMVGAVLLGGSSMVVAQSATSVALVATVPGGGSADRFVDALVGGAVGLAVLAAVPGDPLRQAARATESLLAEVAATLRDVAYALAEVDAGLAQAALDRARTLDTLGAELARTVDSGAETARLAPLRWRARRSLERYARAAPQLEFVLRGTRVLARAALRCVQLRQPVPPSLVDAVRALADATQLVGAELEGGEAAVRAHALRAVAAATEAARDDGSLAVSVVVGQVRSTATDLLAAVGVPRADAVDLVRATAVPAGDAPA